MKTITGFTMVLATAVAALFAVSCSRFEYKEVSAADGKIFHASLENFEAASKTSLDSNHKLLWTTDDRLSIFAGKTSNQQYKYNGEPGREIADFVKVSGSSSGSAISANYAVYPYQASTEIDNSGKISVTLPALQEYAAGTFGPGSNTMVAVTDGTADTYLPFRNLCGYLVVKLYGQGTVKSITLTGDNSEKIAGAATVTALCGQEPSVAMATSSTTSIALDCGSGVVLGPTSSKATEFWFCVPPTTFSKGFTVRAVDDGGNVMVKSVSSSKKIKRNEIHTMSALEAVFQEPVSVKWEKTLPDEIKTDSKLSIAKAADTYVIYNGTSTWSFNPVDGEMTKLQNCIDGTRIKEVFNDDAGNLLTVTKTVPEEIFEIYVTPAGKAIGSVEPSLLIHAYFDLFEKSDIGNFVAKGNVLKDGIVTALAGGSLLTGAYWEIKEGTATSWSKYLLTEEWTCQPVCFPIHTISTVYSPQFAALSPVGTSASEGFLYNGYDGYYKFQFIPKEGPSQILGELGDGNNGVTCIAVKNWGEKEVGIVNNMGWFPQWSGASCLTVFDAGSLTPMANIPLLKEGLEDRFMEAPSTCVLVEEQGKSLVIYSADGAQGLLVKIVLQ